MILPTTSVRVALRAGVRPPRAVLQSVRPLAVEAALPGVEQLSADPVVATRHRHIAGDFLGMAEDGQASTHLTIEQWITHAGSPTDQPTQVSSISLSFRQRARQDSNLRPSA